MDSILPSLTTCRTSSLSPALTALWYDGKRNWAKAHAQVDHLSDPEAAWVRTYMHRKEGDISSADYWYRKAGKQRPAVSLDKDSNAWSIISSMAKQHYLLHF